MFWKLPGETVSRPDRNRSDAETSDITSVYLLWFVIARLSPTDVKQSSILDAFSKPKAAAKPKAKTASLESSDSEAEVKMAKAPVKRKQVSSGSDSSSEDDLMSRIKAKGTTAGKVGPSPGFTGFTPPTSPSNSPMFPPFQKKKVLDDTSFLLSEDEDAAPAEVAPRDKPARARKPVTYNMDSDSDF